MENIYSIKIKRMSRVDRSVASLDQQKKQDGFVNDANIYTSFKPTTLSIRLISLIDRLNVKS
jgi:hypothetical protein